VNTWFAAFQSRFISSVDLLLDGSDADLLLFASILVSEVFSPLPLFNSGLFSPSFLFPPPPSWRGVFPNLHPFIGHDVLLYFSCFFRTQSSSCRTPTPLLLPCYWSSPLLFLLWCFFGFLSSFSFPAISCLVWTALNASHFCSPLCLSQTTVFWSPSFSSFAFFCSSIGTALFFSSQDAYPRKLKPPPLPPTNVLKLFFCPSRRQLGFLVFWQSLGDLLPKGFFFFSPFMRFVAHSFAPVFLPRSCQVSGPVPATAPVILAATSLILSCFD